MGDHLSVLIFIVLGAYPACVLDAYHVKKIEPHTVFNEHVYLDLICTLQLCMYIS